MAAWFSIASHHIATKVYGLSGAQAAETAGMTGGAVCGLALALSYTTRKTRAEGCPGPGRRRPKLDDE